MTAHRSERRQKWEKRKAEAWRAGEVKREARRESGSRLQAKRDASTKRAQEDKGKEESGWVHFLDVLEFLSNLTLGFFEV